MKHHYLAMFILFIVFSLNKIYSQEESAIKENTSFGFHPNFTGIELDASTLIFYFQYGALIDFNIVEKQTKKFNSSFGTRLSYDSYGYVDFGGSVGGNPFRDYNLLLYHSVSDDKISFTVLGGLSYHTKSDDYPSELIPRAGVEVKYYLVENIFALMLKGTTSLEKRTGYLGLGFSVGFHK